MSTKFSSVNKTHNIKTHYIRTALLGINAMCTHEQNPSNHNGCACLSRFSHYISHDKAAGARNRETPWQTNFMSNAI